MKSEPVSDDEVNNSNGNGNESNPENGNPQGPYICPRCSAIFTTRLEMNVHYVQETRRLFKLEMKRRRILQRCRMSQVQIPSPLINNKFPPQPPLDPMMHSQYRFVHNLVEFPPLHALYELVPSGVSSPFAPPGFERCNLPHNYPPMEVPPAPPTPPPSPEHPMTVDFLSLVDRPIAPIADQPTGRQSNMMDVDELIGPEGTTPSPPPPPPPSAPAVAPEAVVTQLSLAQPGSVNKDPAEPDLDLKL